MQILISRMLPAFQQNTKANAFIGHTLKERQSGEDLPRNLPEGLTFVKRKGGGKGKGGKSASTFMAIDEVQSFFKGKGKAKPSDNERPQWVISWSVSPEIQHLGPSQGKPLTQKLKTSGTSQQVARRTASPSSTWKSNNASSQLRRAMAEALLRAPESQPQQKPPQP